MEHVIGRSESDNPGPTLIVVGGLHGNEPAGVTAGARVLEHISDRGLTLAGRLVALRGNIEALEAGCRYIDRDLNRIWQPERVEAVLAGNANGDLAEHEQQRGLAEALEECFAAAEGPVFFLDLHSTSSETTPYFWIVPGGATDVITHFPMPSVYDPTMRIEGTLGQWVAAQGHRVLLAETGQHEDPSAIDHCEAILWITLVQAGLVAEHDLQPEYAHSQDLLRSACDTQGFFHIVYHHKIAEGDDFAMRPGYRSFQSVRKGELLARDRNGEIAAPNDGRILMPLYKPPSEDGFLIVRED